MSKTLSGHTGTVVLSEFTDGINVVQGGTPLKFVNYFDGMLMRAELMKLEQQGMHNLSQLSNQAGGHGVVWGYDTALQNGGINLGAGVAIDPGGRVVYMPEGIELDIEQLLQRAEGAAPKLNKGNPIGVGFAGCVENESPDPVTVIEGTQYYVITVGKFDALCGEEDVYGQLCEEACVTSTDRPYKIDGVVVRAEPLPTGLVLPQSAEVTLSGSHTRSRIASAFYEYEQNQIASHISGEGLAQGIWCNGARLPGGYTRGVPVALLARNGNENLFLDRWIVARERMEAPPRRYWAHIMAMRPWNMFLAQVLQFQCQLNSLFGPGGGTIGNDPCDDTKATMRAISDELQGLIGRHQPMEERIAGAAVEEGHAEWLDSVIGIQQRLRDGAKPKVAATDRILINGGIVEAPSAGYLPVKVNDSQSVNEQVRALLGEGVDLRFCTVRPDFIPHALEEAQHMERISLLEGLDNPEAKPKVDVLVPDGLFGKAESIISGVAYEMTLSTYEKGEDLLESLFASLKDTGLKASERLTEEVAHHASEEIFGLMARHAMVASRAGAAGEVVVLKPDKPGVEDGVDFTFKGAARGFSTAGGGLGFYYAGISKRDTVDASKRYREGLLHDGVYLSARRPIHKSVWMSMSVDEDIMALSVGQYTKAAMELDMSKGLVGGRVGGRSYISADVSLKVLDVRTDYIEVEVLGSFTNHTSFGGGSNIPINHVARVERFHSGTTPGTIISMLSQAMRNNRISIAMTRVWPNPTTARVEFGAVINKSYKAYRALEAVSDRSGLDFAAMIATADQNVNPAVIKADHPAHIASLEALDAISLAAGQLELTASRAQLLFDIDTAVNQAKQIYATRDWALFHRRRDKQCESEIPPLEILNRNYRVFTIKLKYAENVGEVMKLVDKDDWQGLSRLGVELVTNVEFEGGTPNMLSARQRVLSDWGQKANDTTEILYGVAINNPAWNEPGSLAESRMTQTNAVLDDETRISPQAQFGSMASLPPQASGTNDGAMLYVIFDQASTCQRVVRFPRDDNQAFIERFKVALENVDPGDLDGFEKLLVEFKTEEVGMLGFVGQSGDILNDSELMELDQNWQAFGNGPISRVLSVSRGANEKDQVVSQSDFVTRKFDGNNQVIEHVISKVDIGECWGVTCFFPGNVSNEAVYWYDGVASESMLNMINSAVVSRGVEGVLNERWVEEASIRFDSKGEALRDKDLQRLATSISDSVTLSENIEWRAITVLPKEAAADTVALLGKQASTILRLLNENAEVITVNNTSEELPNGANAITLMVPVDTSIDYSVIPVFLAKEGDDIDSSTPQVLFHFDANNELIKDEFFATQIKKLKKLNVELSTAELVGEKKPAANDKRLTRLFAALKENEILKPDARKKTTKLTVEERKALDFGSFRLPEILVLRSG